MKNFRHSLAALRAVLATAGLAAVAGLAQAQISDDVVRIGLMGDLSGPYSGNGGPGSVLGRQDGHRGLRRQGRRQAGRTADHGRPEQARRRAERRAQMAGGRQGGCDRRRLGLVDRAGGADPDEGKAEALPDRRHRHLRPHRQGLLADGLPVPGRHLLAAQGRGADADRQGHQDLLLRDRGLRLRRGAADRGHALHRTGRRQGGGFGQASAGHHRLLVVPAAGAVERRQGDRDPERRAGPVQLAQAGGRVPHHQGRPERERVRHDHQQRRRDGPGDRAGPEHHGALLLGPRRRLARPGASASWNATTAWCRPTSWRASTAP